MSTIKVNAIKHIGGATDAINIASDSDVGIGTNAPVEKLHVHKESATGPFMFITNTSTGVSASDGIQLGYDGDNSTVFKNFVIRTLLALCIDPIKKEINITL